jgi:NADH:ubiquinone oxidoreductase subunit F (NADH-binding)
MGSVDGIARTRLPRLLLGVPAAGAMSLTEHLSTHGEIPAAPSGPRRDAPSLTDELEAAGLCGRGGGGFPTAGKLRAVAAAAGRGPQRWVKPWSGSRRPVVVVNAAEGEPASLKDQTLLEALPHLVLDGASVAARELGARDIVVAVCEQAAGAQDSVARAILERRSRADKHQRWHVANLPAGYVAGQESALVNFLSGRPAKPTSAPPMPFERGVRGRPTLVNNAETFAHVALIARHGAAWFRELGTPSQPGSALLTLSGPVVHPGVYEAEHGSTLASLIEAAGGATQRLRAVLIGGYAGAWVDAVHLDTLALSNAELAPHGATLGTGVVVLLGQDACGLAETARVARWLASESAGQCGPCIYGLDALAGTLERALTGSAERDVGARLDYLASIAAGRSACSHPDGAARFVASALRVFAAELVEHARRGPCPACSRARTLPIPTPRPPARGADARVPDTSDAPRRARRGAGGQQPSRVRALPGRSGAGAS